MENKKIPPHRNNGEAEKEGSFEELLTSLFHDSTAAANCQPFVASVLPKGEGNAITTKELLNRTGFGSLRLLTKEIERERLAGVPILSKCDRDGGYYLPSDGIEGDAEVRRFVQSMKARAASISAVIKKIEKGGAVHE